MTAQKGKTPAKVAGNTSKSKKVDPLSKETFQALMSLIDGSTIKGRDVEVIVHLKLELARVAGVSGVG